MGNVKRKLMKKSNFILSLISIFLPIGLVILFFIEIIVDSIDNFKLNSFHDFLFTLFILWNFTGWFLGLLTGCIGLILSLKSKKKGEHTTSTIIMSIVGISLNLLWILIILHMIPIWMGV